MFFSIGSNLVKSGLLCNGTEIFCNFGAVEAIFIRLAFMILRYRVSLPGIKGFARVYELKSTTTLYDFHKRMRDDMDFSHDQLIQFKGLDENGNLVARYGMFDLGAGAVDEVTVEETVNRGIARFTYFYDVTDRKSVIVTFEGEVEEEPGRTYPALVESKGPNPVEFENGYVAYEDLPDEQRHLPGESLMAKEDKAEKDADDADDIDDIDTIDDDDDDEEDEEDDLKSSIAEDSDEVYDGSEELLF